MHELVNQMTTAASTSQNASSTLLAAAGATTTTSTLTTATSTQQPSSSAVRALAMEYKSLQEEPVEGFRVKLMNDDNLFEWEVAIFGPPDTLYQGGYFKAHMKFPNDYPYSPPSIRFLTKVWHPNVYENGDLCISILHPPVDDPQSGELPCERWNPTQNVRTILLSVISLLNEPNTYSPANVDASVMYRRWRDSQGKDNEYPNIIRKQALAANAEAKREGIVVPMTLEDYCLKPTVKPSTESGLDANFYDDDFDLETEDLPTDSEDEDDEDDDEDDEEDEDDNDDDDDVNEENRQEKGNGDSAAISKTKCKNNNGLVATKTTAAGGASADDTESADDSGKGETS
ncbi:ubiquitin-conjugating enzyme E2 R2 isoform X1 [Drosophila albomicans]|uniref:Ubiquitin-conjugating enzyme E2 R2 isoform X1 n=2 Tax=Drosophila albomicans TaxID=7291 RepID=A0A6P8WS81_DROAB|nr:ubiquitin-conjugating enzyme E2 R2 isoform X1 [Drosophila albomicans]